MNEKRSKDIAGLHADDVLPVPTAADYPTGHKACGIKVGDTVKVLRKPKDHEGDWRFRWERDMDTFVGQTFVVDEDERYGFHVLGGWVPFFVLEKIGQPPWTPKAKDTVLIVKGNRRAEVLGTWGTIAWLNDNGEAITYGFDELRPILPEPEKRERQDGDVVQSHASKSVYLRQHIGRWVCVSDSRYPVLTENDPGIANSTHLFNLLVLLTGGPILVALIEDEAKRGELALSQDNDSRNNHLWQKVSDALIAYQKRK